MSRHEIVLCSLERWDHVWRRNQYLVAGLLERDPQLRVLFVEPVADPLHAALTKQPVARGTGLREIGGYDSQLWALEPTKWLPRKLGRTADRWFTRNVLTAAAALDFTAPLLWINDPGAAMLLKYTDWPALYDITDDWLLAERGAAEHSRLVRSEALLMNRSREVVVCSPQLQAAKALTRPVHLIPNAVDVAAYRRSYERPADLGQRPYALYVGTLHEDRLDVDLCVAAAREIAEHADLVFLGPNALSAASAERLSTVPTLKILGARAREAVPAYLQHAAVLVVPHLITPFTDSLDPLKLYEYLASGRPVVSTAVAGFRDSSAARVSIADSASFGCRVRQSLAAGQSPLDAAAAAHHRASDAPVGDTAPVDVIDWAVRVEQMAELISVI